MSCARQYNKAFTIQVMEMYKSFPCLWNSRCEDYNNKQVRQEAIDNLVEKFAEVEPLPSEHMVRAKFLSWKKTWTREYSKMITTNGEYVPTLWYFKNLNFIAKELLSSSENFPEEEDSDILCIDITHEKAEEDDDCQEKYASPTILLETDSQSIANPEVELPAHPELPVIAETASITQNAFYETCHTEVMPAQKIKSRYKKRGRKPKHSKVDVGYLRDLKKFKDTTSEPSQLNEIHKNEHFRYLIYDDFPGSMKPVDETAEICPPKILKRQYRNQDNDHNTTQLSVKDLPGPRRSEKLSCNNLPLRSEDGASKVCPLKIEDIEYRNHEDEKNAVDTSFDNFLGSIRFKDGATKLYYPKLTEILCRNQVDDKVASKLNYDDLPRQGEFQGETVEICSPKIIDRSQEDDQNTADFSFDNLRGSRRSEDEASKLYPPEITNTDYRNQKCKKNSAESNFDDLPRSGRFDDLTTKIGPPKITQIQCGSQEDFRTDLYNDVSVQNDAKSSFINHTGPRRSEDRAAKLCSTKIKTMEYRNLEDEPNDEELACSDLAELNTFEDEAAIVGLPMQRKSQKDVQDVGEISFDYLPDTKRSEDSESQPSETNLMQSQPVEDNEDERDKLRTDIHPGLTRLEDNVPQIRSAQKRDMETNTCDLPIPKRSKCSESPFRHLANYWAEKLEILNPKQRILVEKIVSNLFCEAELENLTFTSRIIHGGPQLLAFPLNLSTPIDLIGPTLGAQQIDRDLVTTLEYNHQMQGNIVSSKQSQTERKE